MHKDLVCEWKYSIFNKEHSIFNYELGIGASVRKRKSSFDGGAGMSGANAGGGCWLCSISYRFYLSSGAEMKAESALV